MTFGKIEGREGEISDFYEFGLGPTLWHLTRRLAVSGLGD